MGVGPAFGIYIAYFLGLYLVFSILDYCSFCNGLSERLAYCFDDFYSLHSWEDTNAVVPSAAAIHLGVPVVVLMDVAG